MLRSLLETALVPLSSATAALCPGAPEEELDTLVVSVVAAVYLADAGDPGAGYTCLLAAFRRAEALDFPGEEWPALLALRYRRIMRNFADRYSVAVE